MGRSDDEDDDEFMDEGNEEVEEERQEDEEEEKAPPKAAKEKKKKIKGSDDDDDDDEEEEEGEEAEEGKPDAAPPRRVFSERLQDPLPPVETIELVIPKSSDDHEKETVRVRLTNPRVPFERAFRRPLKKLARANILRQLADDEDSLREYLAQEAELEEAGGADGDGEDNDNDEDELAEEEGALPYPYWLPSLLAKDIYYVERICSCMYGWLVNPAPLPKSVLKLTNAREGHVSFKNGEEEDDEELPADPVRKSSNFFQPSGAFNDRQNEEGEGEDDEEEGGGDAKEETEGAAGGSSSTDERGGRTGAPKPLDGIRISDVSPPVPEKHTASIVPAPARPSGPKAVTMLTGVPAFPHATYPLFLCRDTVTEEWHLLDRHPLLATRRFKEEAAQAQAQAGGRAGDDDDDDEEEEEEKEADDEEVGGGRKQSDAEPIPHYDLSTLWETDALMLAALQSPAILRLMLLQKAAPAPGEAEAKKEEGDEDPEGRMAKAPNAGLLRNVQRWLKADLRAGFPFLSAIYQGLLGVRARDVARLPHPIATVPLDFNIFFSPEYMLSLPDTPHLVASSSAAATGPGGASEGVASSAQEMVPPASVEALSTMKSLLQAGIVPSAPVQLQRLRDWESVQVVLWLLTVMPRDQLLLWGDMAKARARRLREAGGGGGVSGAGMDDDDEEEEEEEEELGSLTESVILDKIEAEKERQRREEAKLSGPALLPAPFLLHVLLEVRRRLERVRDERPPSLHSLLTCVERYYKPEKLEDNTPLGDPLVTSLMALPSTVGILALCNTQCSELDMRRQLLREPMEAEADAAAGPAPSTGVIRHQRIFQSDLVLLLLGFTATPLPRKMALERMQEVQELKSAALDVVSMSSLVTVRKVMAPQRDSVLYAGRNSGCGGGGGGGGGSGSNSVVMDGNLELFATVLREKLARPRSPMERARSGTYRLLFLSIPRFRRFAVIRELCVQSPLYQLFGAAQPCPLAELVLCWSMERRGQTGGQTTYLDVFLNTFWLELHLRLTVHAQQIDLSVAQFIRMRMVGLLDKIKDRHGRYQNMLTVLAGSDVGRGSITAAATTVAAQAKMGLTFDTISLRTLTPHSEQYKKEEKRVRAIFDALSTLLEERSFYTPEMLHSLLFDKVSKRDFVAIRYLIVRRGVTTVRENPFTGVEMNALEYAIRRRDYCVARLLVGVGFPLNGLVDDGSQTLGTLAEALLPSDKVRELKRVFSENEAVIASDPKTEYGILRVVQC